MGVRLNRRGLAVSISAAALALMTVPAGAQTPAGQPITIGFGMSLTGPLAANGKQALLGMKIWEEEINAKGGLLGRPVKLVYYDDQSNPSTVPGIYTKLLDVDKVDLVIGPYATDDDRAGDAGRDAEGQGLHQPVRARGEQRVQLSEILRDDPDRARHQAVVHRRLLRGRRGAESEAADRRAGRRRRGVLHATPATARARTPRRPAARSSTTSTYPPTHDRLLRRSCARSRRPIPTSSRSAPIRSTRSAWSRRSTRSASSRR